MRDAAAAAVHATANATVPELAMADEAYEADEVDDADEEDTAYVHTNSNLAANPQVAAYATAKAEEAVHAIKYYY